MNARSIANDLPDCRLQRRGQDHFRQGVSSEGSEVPALPEADEIARGLSPLDPAAGATKAARLLLREVSDTIQSRQTFGLETTLSGLTYVRLLINAREQAYAVKLFYLWLPSATVAIRRVRERVRKGGHSVPVTDIRRRYKRSLRNLVGHYLPLADEWTLFDNSGREPRVVADGVGSHARVMDETLYRQIQSCRT